MDNPISVETTDTRAAHVRAVPTVWYRPAVDVFEGTEGFRLVLDVPGVSKAALEVTVEGRKLTVSGRRAKGNAGWRHAFTLPDVVDTERIHADLADGVLTLDLPRRPELSPRKIEIA